MRTYKCRFGKRAIAVIVVLMTSVSGQINAQVWDGGAALNNWSIGLNWNGDFVPANNSTANVTIGAPAPAILNVNANLNSLTVEADGVLNFNPSVNLDFIGGSAANSLTNFGTITTGNNTDLQLHLLVMNSGEINVVSTGSATDLEVTALGAELDGGGFITLGGTDAARINGVSNPSLTIIDQTIQGFGQIGVNSISIDNQGNLINSNSNGNPLTIDPNAGGMTNTGTLRASGGGILNLGSGIFSNIDGLIEALPGSEVRFLQGSDIVEGTLTTTGDGLLLVPVSANAFFTDVTNTGDMLANNNSDFGITGFFTNSGTVTITSTGSATDIEVQPVGATIDGGGLISLGGTTAARINGVSNPLLTIADQTIDGFGQIGANSIEIDNQGNLIDANADGQPLTIDPNADGMTNTGTLQASDGGILQLNSATYTNTNGLVQALADSEVRFLEGASIVDGILDTTGSGLLRVNASTSVFFTDVTNTGDMLANNNSDFGISGVFTNEGTVSITSTGSATDIEVQATGAMINGGGSITLGGTSNARINGVSNPSLTIVDQTIDGFGQIGVNTISIDNQGNLINANSSGNPLTIDPNAGGMINTGTLRASGGGILNLNAAEYTNTSGLIQALAGSEVRFLEGSDVVNGTLTSAGDGLLRVPVSINAFFTDVTNTGSMLANNNSDVGISGSFTNSGTVTVTSTGSATDIEVQAVGAMIDGGGTITLGGTTNARINGVGNPQLTIVDQTIEGFGQIGVNTLAINNQGNTIDANSPDNPLILDPNTVGFTNTGILQASNDGRLEFNAGVYTNSGGVIRAMTGSEVRFREGTVVVGGELTTQNDGLLSVDTSTNVFFENLTNSGTVVTRNNSDLGFNGTITNNGTISVNSTGSATDIEIQPAGAVLTGTGTTTLSQSNSRINGSGDLEMTDGRLAGVGQVAVDSVIRQQAVVAPGNSIGTMTFNGNHDTQIVDGGSIEIEVGALTGTAGVDWDFLDVNGTLDFDDSVLPSGATINLVSLDGNGDPGLLAGFNQGVDSSWLIADCTTIEGFSSSFVTVNTSQFLNSFCGIFTVTQTGNQLFLNYVSQVVEVAADGATTIRGIVLDGDVTDVFESDDLYLQYNPGFTLSAAEPPVWVEFEGTVAAGVPQWLNLKLESSANTPNIVQTVEMFNFVTGQFELVDTRATTFNVDKAHNIAIPIPDEFIQPGTNLVRARSGWRQDGFTLLFPWTVRIDFVVWLLQ